MMGDVQHVSYQLEGTPADNTIELQDSDLVVPRFFYEERRYQAETSNRSDIGETHIEPKPLHHIAKYYAAEACQRESDGKVEPKYLIKLVSWDAVA